MHFFPRSFIPATCIILFCTACASLPRGSFSSVSNSSSPDYSLTQNWAALPATKDSADAVPIPAWQDVQSNAAVDIFFIHPTTMTGRSGDHDWNGSLENTKLNLRTDRSAIRYQASLFNGAGKIYAPRYRQAHLNCFFTKHKKEDAANALELAYQDVKASFNYYLLHFNQGRPFIVAGHSQGSLHGARLLKEAIENTPYVARLVVAYLPGMPVKTDYFMSLKPCQHPEETGCYCSWRTFKRGYLPPKYHFPGSGIVVTNPVTWDVNKPRAGKDTQLGAVLRDFNEVLPHLVSTEVHEDLLWVNKPKFPWSFLFTRKNYHIGDYNFFYADVRQNAIARVNAYFQKQ